MVRAGPVIPGGFQEASLPLGIRFHDSQCCDHLMPREKSIGALLGHRATKTIPQRCFYIINMYAKALSIPYLLS